VTHPTDTDEALMRRFQRGEAEAFTVLLGRHRRSVYNFVLRFVRAAAAAEDLTQDAFVRVVQGSATFQHDARFTTWLFSIARNLCVDHLRKMTHRRHASLDQADGPDSSAPALVDRVAGGESSGERAAIGTQLRERIAQAIDTLPDDQREVFLLREVGCVPFREIAAIVGVNENTVKSRMRYALLRLQEALSEYEEYARSLA
jgi:RNA polymerase sigma-70 factor (ECF subfamily)